MMGPSSQAARRSEPLPPVSPREAARGCPTQCGVPRPRETLCVGVLTARCSKPLIFLEKCISNTKHYRLYRMQFH